MRNKRRKKGRLRRQTNKSVLTHNPPDKTAPFFSLHSAKAEEDGRIRPPRRENPLDLCFMVAYFSSFFNSNLTPTRFFYQILSNCPKREAVSRKTLCFFLFKNRFFALARPSSAGRNRRRGQKQSARRQARSSSLRGREGRPERYGPRPRTALPEKRGSRPSSA